MESLQHSLSSLSDLFHKRMADFEAELPIAQGTPSITDLKTEYACFKKIILELMSQFQQQLDLIVRSVDNIEMRSRRKMLLLHGIPEEEREITPDVVCKVVNQHLKLSNFSNVDIRRCHRMGRSSSSHKPRPIVVKFQTTTIRDGLWYAKTKLKGSGITISEFLTKQRHETFIAARQLFGISQSWTKEGTIYVIGVDGVRHHVTNLGELHKLKQQVSDKSTITPIATTVTVKPAAKSKRIISQKKH